MLSRPDPKVPAVGVHAAEQLISSGAMLVDVREQAEWLAARIPRADFKPMSEINDWFQSLPREDQIIFYCRTGQRSEEVTRALVTQAGFTNVVNLLGGIVAWHEAGLIVDFDPPNGSEGS